MDDIARIRKALDYLYEAERILIFVDSARKERSKIVKVLDSLFFKWKKLRSGVK